VSIRPRRILAETVAVFGAAFTFLSALAPTAPFTRELGVCESGAVRDVLAGNIILPHFIPGPMVHVPPLYWWTAALCVHIFGWTELALRMPSMITAAMTCAIVYGWAAVAINRRTAFWSVVSLLLCHFYLDAARQPRMDSMLALFVTAATVAFERALRPCHAQDLTEASDVAGRFRTSAIFTATGAAINAACPHHFDRSGDIAPSALIAPLGSPSRRIGLTLAALTMGLGVLTKGVLGILLPDSTC
jgi:4-amino-4-deoxy-L-arabinose transferase-like glycosyltransferase